MRRHLSIIGCALWIALSWSLPALAGSDRFDDPVFCSNWYATQPDNSLDPDKKRRCLIAIATTYPDGEANQIPIADMLLCDDIVRWSTDSERPDPMPGNAQRIRDGLPNVGIENWGSDHPDWTVDLTTNRAFLIWDILIIGFPEPTVFVSEVFTIENGCISEVLIGGVNILD